MGLLKCQPQITVFPNKNFVCRFYYSGLGTLLLCLHLTFCLDFAESSLLQKWRGLCEAVGATVSWPGCPVLTGHAVVKAHSCAWGASGTSPGGQRLQDRSSGELTSASGLGPSLLLTFSQFNFVLVCTCFLRTLPGPFMSPCVLFGVEHRTAL